MMLSSDEDYCGRCERLEVQLNEVRRLAREKQTRIEALEREVADLTQERDHLLRFKQYVHQRLDSAGVPMHPKGEHSAQGCRVGDRLDLVLSEARRHNPGCKGDGVNCERIHPDQHFCHGCGQFIPRGEVPR